MSTHFPLILTYATSYISNLTFVWISEYTDCIEWSAALCWLQSSCSYPKDTPHAASAGVDGRCMWLEGTIYSDASAAWVLIAAIIVFFMVSAHGYLYYSWWVYMYATIKQNTWVFVLHMPHFEHTWPIGCLYYSWWVYMDCGGHSECCIQSHDDFTKFHLASYLILYICM